MGDYYRSYGIRFIPWMNPWLIEQDIYQGQNDYPCPWRIRLKYKDKQRLLPRLLKAKSKSQIVSIGFSCRHQVTDLSGRKSRHVAEVLRGGCDAAWDQAIWKYSPGLWRRPAWLATTLIVFWMNRANVAWCWRVDEAPHGFIRLGVIWRITLPLSLPAIASVALYVFMIA